MIVIVWNLNYGSNGVMDENEFLKEFANDGKQFVKDGKEFAKSRKEFQKASRKIYKLISGNPQITTVQMAVKLKISQRQVQKYLKRLQDTGKIVRLGNRKNSEWKITDEEYEDFFERI